MKSSVYFAVVKHVLTVVLEVDALIEKAAVEGASNPSQREPFIKLVDGGWLGCLQLTSH